MASTIGPQHLKGEAQEQEMTTVGKSYDLGEVFLQLQCGHRSWVTPEPVSADLGWKEGPVTRWPHLALHEILLTK